MKGPHYLHYMLALSLGYTPAEARKEMRDYLKRLRAATKGKRISAASAKKIAKRLAA